MTAKVGSYKLAIDIHIQGREGKKRSLLQNCRAELFKWWKDFRSVLGLTREVLKGLGKLKDWGMLHNVLGLVFTRASSIFFKFR